MTQRMRLAPLALALGLGLAPRADAQQQPNGLPPVSIQDGIRIQAVTPRPTHKKPRHRDPVNELIQSSLVPVEASIREVPFNRPQARYDGIIYDNTNVPTGGSLFYFSGTTASPTFNLLDDFDLFPGATDVTTPASATATSILVALENYATTVQTVYGTVTIYNALDFSASATNIASMPLGSYTFQLTGANRPTAGGHAYNLTLPTPLSLTHDLGNDASPYAVQIALFSNSTRTTGHTKVTPLFNGNGVCLGESFDVFWDDVDKNSKFDPNTEGFFAGGGVGNFCDFYFQITGNTVNNPTYEVSGVISFPDLVPTADVQNVTWTFHSLTAGNPDIVVHGTVDPKAPNSGAYTILGLPADMYTLHIKPDKFLAANVVDSSSALQTIDLTTCNYLGSADVTVKGGDATNDNSVDIADFSAMVSVYTDVYTVGDPMAPAADVAADFNGDGSIDGLDFGILVNNYSSLGDP